MDWMTFKTMVLCILIYLESRWREGEKFSLDDSDKTLRWQLLFGSRCHRLKSLQGLGGMRPGGGGSGRSACLQRAALLLWPSLATGEYCTAWPELLVWKESQEYSFSSEKGPDLWIWAAIFLKYEKTCDNQIQCSCGTPVCGLRVPSPKSPSKWLLFKVT